MSPLPRAASMLLPCLLAAACAAPANSPAPAAAPPAEAQPTPRPAPSPEPKPPERDEWVVLETDEGEIWLNLFEERTPAHAENFKKLVRQGWYDGSPFHRVIPGFVAQGGGHWVDGSERTRDVGYEIPAEIRGDLRHLRGSLAAARSGDHVNPQRRSSGSQFYICLRPQRELDLKYTVFGQVIHGLDVVDQLKSGPPGKEGDVPPEEASVIRRALIRPANEPGSAPADDHAGHQH